MPTIAPKTKAAPVKKPGQKSRLALAREELIFYGVILGCVLTLLIHFWAQVWWAHSASKKNLQEVQAKEALHQNQVHEAEDRYAEEIKIVQEASTEDRATRQRTLEFERRGNFEPMFAKSDTEKAMLEMKKLGENPAAGAEALTKIAKLACPPKSGVAVTPIGSGENAVYKVEIAISHKEVTESVLDKLDNYLPGIYFEVRLTAAGIIKDLMMFGGGKVSSVTVHCQNKVTVKMGDSEKSEVRDIMVVSAGAGADYKNLTRNEIVARWQTIKDDYPTLLKNK